MITPVVSFSPDVTSDGALPTMTLDGGASQWLKNDATGAIYEKVYTLADNNVYDPHVNVTVSGGARDWANNPQTDYTATDVFTVNTQSISANVVAVRPGLQVVTNLNVTGTETQPAFTVTVDYDQPMSLSSSATITFSPNVSSSLVLEYAFWTGDTTWKAWYDVLDANVDLSGISINVSGAQDRVIDPGTGRENFAAEHDQARFIGRRRSPSTRWTRRRRRIRR